MRSRILIVGLLVRLVMACPAHAKEPSARRSENAVYLEGGGPALFYSVNYDRRFHNFAARIGVGFLALSAKTSGSGLTPPKSGLATFLAVPLTLSYLANGRHPNMFELGVGVSVFHGQAAFETADQATLALVPVALVGYRREPPNGGFLLRAGLSLLGETNRRLDFPLALLPWPYLAVGGAFD